MKTLFADAFVFVDYAPPKIEPPEKEQIVSVGGKLTLKCSGEQPVTWEFPMINSPREEYQDLTPTSVISVSYDPTSVLPYRVLLEVFNVSIVDVGFYTCLFNITDDTDKLEEMEQKGQATTVYVYVNGESLYANVFAFLSRNKE